MSRINASEVGETIRRSMILSCAGDDLLHDWSLRVRIVLDVLPFLLRELPLRAFVERAVGLVGSKPVPEEQVALDLLVPFRKHMDLCLRIVVDEHAVLVERRLAHAELVPGGL